MGSVIGYREAHGPVATFETDVAEKIKSLIVDVEPVQDLHGYDYPWPAGGGKNKLHVTAQSTTINGVTFTINNDGTVTANGTATQNTTLIVGTYIGEGVSVIASGCPSGGNRTDKYRIFNTYIGSDEGNGTNAVAPNVGNSCNVTLYVYAGYTAVNLVFKPMIRLASETDATFAPYSNICPITGWTAASITHHGKNMAQYWQNAYIGADGSIKTGSTYAMAKPIFVQNGRSIAVSNTAGDYQGIAVFSDSSLENMIYRLANTASTYIAEQDCYIVFWFNKVYSEYTQSDFVSRGVQIEFSYNPTDFESYKHDEYDIAFPSAAGTVYGGKLDVVKGELVVDIAQIASYNGETLPGEWISDRDVYAAGASPTTGAQVVYELATPITYQLTPQEINTIIGTNTIYADTGDTSVIYPKTITPVETASNVNLLELRRNIIAAQAYSKTVDVTLNLGTHQVYPTDSIESLRKYLTVVSRGNEVIVTDYTLRGSIDTVGNHQIIIDCHPGIATIQVPVVANPSGILYEWDFTKSLTDERQNYTAILKTGEADEVPGKSAGTTPPVRGNTGAVFNNAQQVLRLLDSNIDSSALMYNKTIQVDVAEFDFVYNNTLSNEPRRACFIMFGDPLSRVNKGSMLYTRGIILNNEWKWIFFKLARDGESWVEENILLSGKNAISGHTIGIYRNNSGTLNFYVDGKYKNTSKSILPPTDLHGLQIGAGGRPQYGGAFYNARITGVRIYDGNVYSS